MLDYFKRFFAILFGGTLPRTSKSPQYKLSPEGIVELAAKPEESEREYLWSSVNHVGILTTSDGPWCEDVYFVIKTDNGTIMIDQSHAAKIELFEQFARLPGFNYEQVILAMGCTDDAAFNCWERELAATS
ncbi:MAG: hypothetical protein WCT03_01930 [Candidatus Obscuribacterales bacterium]|jgi:hypothetical protein